MGSAYCTDSPCDMALGTFYADVYDNGYVALHPLFGDDGRYDVYYIYGLHDEFYSLGVLHHGGYVPCDESAGILYSYGSHTPRKCTLHGIDRCYHRFASKYLPKVGDALLGS